MYFLEKVKFINSLEKIFTIKTGKLIKINDKCYKANKWFSVFFKYYYSFAIPIIAVIFIFLLMPHYFENLVLQFFEAIMVILLVEYFLVILAPLNEVSCLDGLNKEVLNRNL